MSIESFMEEYAGISAAPRFGRSIRDGYARGHGLAYGDLAAKIQGEGDYQEAFAIAAGRSVCAEHRLMNLYLLIRFFAPKLGVGDIIEFGCYRGGSAIFMASLAKRYLPQATVWGLDSFEGMPQPDHKVDLHGIGNFRDTDFEALQASTREMGNLRFVKGLFEHTADKVIAGKSFVLAHIDCDIQPAVVYSWERVKSHTVPGGYVVFDDATEASCLGATEAVEREVIQKGLCSEQIYPHYVFRYPPIG